MQVRLGERRCLPYALFVPEDFLPCTFWAPAHQPCPHFVRQRSLPCTLWAWRATVVYTFRPATFPTVYTLDAAPSHRAHFPARNVPSRAHFLAAPAKTARTVRTFRHKRVPTVHTNGPLVYTVGGLPCRNVRTVGVLFAVNAFRPERVPAVYTYDREARGLDGA